MQASAEIAIKASELRLGNWVNYRPFNEHFTVKEITPAAFSVLSGTAYDCILTNGEIVKYATMAQTVPIELTPQTLEKCGFEARGFNKELKLRPYTYLVLGVNGDDDSLYDVSLRITDKDGGFMYLPTEIKYVHQLQNLYFSLTGSELEINL